ncbi:MAG: stage 0 sporulation protein J [Chloroflexi bacterium 44-23]|nr:MAG: stage 0 sporulation protein J [Chloroflexi bacterium 44-23]
MAKRPGLGRGLDALIPPGSTSFQSAIKNNVVDIDVNQIIPNTHQPRKEMDTGELEHLAESIREHGIIQPLILMPISADNKYELIAGERRLRAAKIAGLATVPAIIRKANEQEKLELALIENIQRTDLGPLETAEAYHQLAEDFNLSHDEIAARVGKSRVSVTNTIRLLKLPEVVRQALAEHKISEGHARALLGLNSVQAQIAVLETILKFEYSVRQTEELVRKYGGERPARKTEPETQPEIRALEERLRSQFGMRVNLDHHGEKGRIVIHYYSNEELNRFIDQIFPE